MIGQDHVRRLSLFDQRCNDFINLVKPFSGQVNSGSGRSEAFFINPLGCFSIVNIFGLNGAFVSWRFAAIAYERSLFNLSAVFPLKLAAYIIAFMAGPAFGITDYKFPAGIRLPTVEAVNAKVIGVIKTAAVPCIDNPVSPYFFGDGRRVLAKIFGNLAEGLSFIKAVFDIDSVIQSQMFMISWY